VCRSQPGGPRQGRHEALQLTEGAGIPLATVSAPANTVDHQLLGQTLDALKDFQPLPCRPTVHLDAGYDYRPSREALDERGLLHHPCAMPGRLAPLPLGHPAKISTHPLTYWRGL
jgi:hypothetical protein